MSVTAPNLASTGTAIMEWLEMPTSKVTRASHEVPSVNRYFAKGVVVVALNAFATQAHGHPHIFADARFDVIADKAGLVQRLRHLWRFDEVFSSTVILEFDRDGNFKLDEAELRAASAVIHKSLGDYNYFQMVAVDGKDVEMSKPERMMATMDSNQLIIFFETLPKETLHLKGQLVFRVYDPTFYTALDFAHDDYMAVENMPSHCRRTVIRPDPDEAIAENQNSLTQAFFTDPTDFSKLFATRLQLDC